jgi:hypothetical protein
VQLEVNELRELGGTQSAGKRLLSAVQPHVSLKVGGGREPFSAHLKKNTHLSRVKIQSHPPEEKDTFAKS